MYLFTWAYPSQIWKFGAHCNSQNNCFVIRTKHVPNIGLIWLKLLKALKARSLKWTRFIHFPVLLRLAIFSARWSYHLKYPTYFKVQCTAFRILFPRCSSTTALTKTGLLSILYKCSIFGHKFRMPPTPHSRLLQHIPANYVCHTTWSNHVICNLSTFVMTLFLSYILS